MSAHSPVNPSSAARWLQCPGSVRLAAQYPDDDSEPAREGTAAHHALALLTAEQPCDVGMVAPNGVILTAEMIEAAEVAYDAARIRLGRATALGDAGAVCERTIPIKRVHEQCYGTPDLRAWLPRFVLYVQDFKFGHGYVDAFENWQLICYVAGLLEEPHVKEWNLSDEAVTVVMEVVQPRSYSAEGPVREWVVNASDLRTHINRLSMAAHEALGDNPTLRAGPECRYCPARHACPVLQREGYRIADAVPLVPPVELPPEALGVELRYLTDAQRLLDARVEGLSEQVKSLARQGSRVPGWMLKQEPGREVWTVPAAEVITAGTMLGVDLAKPPEALTPNQARAAGVPADVVAAFATRPAGALKLKPDDGTDARRVFSKS